jgi:hypothetical protein
MMPKSSKSYQMVPSAKAHKEPEPAGELGQRPPTTSEPVRQHYQMATEGIPGEETVI